MPHAKQRRAFESGHNRKFLVLIDDTPEFRTALYFAARIASRTSGRLAMLHVIDTPVKSGWMPVEVKRGAQTNKLTTEVVKGHRAWLKEKGVEGLITEAITRSGNTAEEILRVVQQDEDIAVLVLGAADSEIGPGPVVSDLTHGRHPGDFPIPIYLVPGNLSFEEITALA